MAAAVKLQCNTEEEHCGCCRSGQGAAGCRQAAEEEGGEWGAGPGAPPAGLLPAPPQQEPL